MPERATHLNAIARALVECAREAAVLGEPRLEVLIIDALNEARHRAIKVAIGRAQEANRHHEDWRRH